MKKKIIVFGISILAAGIVIAQGLGGGGISGDTTYVNGTKLIVSDANVTEMCLADTTTCSAMGASGIAALVDDLSPQLGGDLDGNGHTITNMPDVTDAYGFKDGLSTQQQSLSVVVSGASVYLDVVGKDGGDIDYWIDGTKYTLDCTTGSGVGGAARVELAQGTAIVPTRSFTYVAYDSQGGSLKLYNSIVQPTGAFSVVAINTIQDYATVDVNGALLFQRTTEAIQHNSRGSIAWMREKLRAIGAEHLGGIDPSIDITTNAGSEDSVDFQVQPGVVFQLHRQSFPNLSVLTDGAFVVGASGSGVLTNYEKITDLSSIKETSDGAALTDGDSVNLVIWGSINYGDEGKLFVNLPNGKYASDSDAVADVNDTANYSIPSVFKTTGFLIAKVVLRYNTADSGTWTNLLTESLETWHSQADTTTSPNYPSNYPNNSDVTTTITKSGATKVKVHFEAFNTEGGFDYVRLYDGSDVLQYTYDGNLGSFTSGEISGDTVKVRFTSDTSVTRAGFSIDMLEYATTAASGAEVVDLRGVPANTVAGGIGSSNFNPDPSFNTVGFESIPSLTYGTTTTADWTNSNVEVVTLTGNVGTFTFTDPVQVGQTVKLKIKQDATGSRTVTAWDSDIQWADGGTAPTLSTAASAEDWITCIYTNQGTGEKYDCAASLDFQ